MPGYTPWSAADLLRAHAHSTDTLIGESGQFRSGGVAVVGSDGNGRIGRLWQTLVLAQWNPLFAWVPIATLVHHHQALYYKALQDSHAGAQVDCRPVINFMLDTIANSLYKYIDVATQTVVDVPVNVPANVPVNELSVKILRLVRANPKVTAQKMALALGVTDKTIKRHLKALREQGRIQRVGSDKADHWEVIERPV